MLFFTSLYFSVPSGSNFFFLSSLLLSHRSRSWWSLNLCIFVAHDGEKCKLSANHSWEGFQHIGIFRLFEVKLESCVFWLAGFLPAKAEGHHQQVVITSNVCSWKTPVLWHCSPLIGSASSLECNQSCCRVVHLGCARSICWMPCDDRWTKPDHCCTVTTRMTLVYSDRQPFHREMGIFR